MTEEIKKPAPKLLDWLPGAKDVVAFEGIERELRTRKRSGNRWSFVLAGLGVVYQLLVHFQGKELAGLGKLVAGVLPEAWAKVLQQQPAAVGLALLVAAALVFIGVRFTSLLLTLSREPFRYSFSVAPFNPLSDDRASLEAKDRLALLPLDLTERLANRIKRLSLLRAAPAAGAATADGPSHIAIAGEIALREDADGAWELFAMPRVRIGDAGAAETLSFSVRFPLPGARTEKGEVPFSAEQYEQFCERVYASVALAIYERIDADLEDKVAQFPTTFRRAVARLNEADDFAQSNTIDANARAETQYQNALEAINRTWSLALARWACALQLPVAWYLRVFELHAAILAGMARCAVTRSMTAKLAGRLVLPSYAARTPLLRLLEALRPIQRRAARRAEFSFTQSLVAARLPRLEIRRQARQRRQKRLTRALFDSLVAMALAHSHADEPARARTRLDEALAIGPDIALRDRNYLWVDALLWPDLEGRIDRLRRLMDMAPNFQIGQYQLAVALEMRMRALDQITPDGARPAIAEYERVLAINPGNVAALASVGYLHWLLDDLGAARRRFEEGLALRDVVRETFVGELNYGLARVWAEQAPAGDVLADARQLHRALACFEIAFDTAPDLATADIRTDRSAAAGELEFIGATLLRRFGLYRRGVARRLRAPRRSRDAQVVAMQPALDRLYAFVSNDAGNAALQFHVRLRDPPTLRRAGRLFALAVRVWQHCAAAHVNSVRQAEWSGVKRSPRGLDIAQSLRPDWHRPRVERLSVLHEDFRARRQAQDWAIDRLQRQLDGVRRELSARPGTPDAAQSALRAMPGDTAPRGDLAKETSRREALQADLDRLAGELRRAEAEREAGDAGWLREVDQHLSSQLRRFAIGRLIDDGGALPTERCPRPFSSQLNDPTVDVERLPPADQELLLSALLGLQFLATTQPRVGDEILRCCTALRRRLSDEDWRWVRLQCEVLEQMVPAGLHEADRHDLKLVRQQQLAAVAAWTKSDPVHTNARQWQLRLHAIALTAGELTLGEFDAGLRATIDSASGPMATPLARRGVARVLLELSAEFMGDDPRPTEHVELPPPAAPRDDAPREYWRVLVAAVRRIAPPRTAALRTDWAGWYDAAANHLQQQAGTSALRQLRLAALAAGRAVQPAARLAWWSRCAEIASRALVAEPDRFAAARVDFARWYDLALRHSAACGRVGGVALADPAHSVADRLRQRFFDTEPPRDTRLAPVAVLLGEQLVALVASGDYQLTPEVEATIQSQRADWLQRLGIAMPPLSFRKEGAGAAPGSWGLLLREVPTVQGEVDPAANTSLLSQMMAQVQAELELRLPALVGVQDINGLLEEADVGLAKALRRHPRGLPRLLALAQALLAERLPLDVAAMARLVLDEAAPDFDQLVLRARATERVRRRLVERAAEIGLWALPQPLQRRLLDFIDGAGDSRSLALWPGDARQLLTAMQARAPASGVLGVVVDEPLLLTGVAAALRLSHQPSLVLLRGELPLHQQFALQGEIDDVVLVGAG